MYKSITISKGSGGWGGPLTIMPTDTCNKIVSVTGGGIHPVAIKIAEMTGCEAVDGFTSAVPDDQILVAVVDCGGTARCGVYPKKIFYGESNSSRKSWSTCTIYSRIFICISGN